MHTRAVMKTLVHAHIIVLVSVLVLQSFHACGERTCTAAWTITLDNWSSGSLAGRAVRVANGLPKLWFHAVYQDITANTADVSSSFVRSHGIYK